MKKKRLGLEQIFVKLLEQTIFFQAERERQKKKEERNKSMKQTKMERSG